MRIVCFVLPALLAQTASPVFEVASIKANTLGTNQSKLDLQPGGRFTAINVSFFMLVNFAYGDGAPLPPNRLVFGPQWNGGDGRLSTDRFDILAKGADVRTQKDVPAALRALLAERFKLVVHHESRERPVYALVLARADRRLGPRLRRSTIDCADPSAAPPNADGSPSCGFRNAPGRATGRATIGDLVRRLLSRAVEDQRVVEDHTGLDGTYEFDLEWTPNSPSPTDGPPTTADPDAPPIFTALREQLGLKLEPQTGRIDVIVVDHAAFPTPN
jgi:uncharacterized protein (TIGR03435 family)